MPTETIRAQITSDGPLQGAELLIRWDGTDVSVDVRLDPIGRHPSRWVPLPLVDSYLQSMLPDYGDAA